MGDSGQLQESIAVPRDMIVVVHKIVLVKQEVVRPAGVALRGAEDRRIHVGHARLGDAVVLRRGRITVTDTGAVASRA